MVNEYEESFIRFVYRLGELTNDEYVAFMVRRFGSLLRPKRKIRRKAK